MTTVVERTRTGEVLTSEELSALAATRARSRGEESRTRYVWAMLRISVGWIWLWAFLDKTFGFGFATEAGKGWIDGGSPTFGFLSFATKGPFAEFFSGFAGNAAVDWMFMTGLLGVGVALLLGIGVRLAGYAGAAMALLMYAASAILPEHNLFMDEHILYAIIFIGLSMVGAGRTLGLGRWWSETALVRRLRFLV